MLTFSAFKNSYLFYFETGSREAQASLELVM